MFPYAVTGRILPSSSAVSFMSSTPRIFGMSGPWISPSSTPTRKPSRARLSARFADTVDLPTPPFPLMTMIVLFIFESWRFSLAFSSSLFFSMPSSSFSAIRFSLMRSSPA